MLAIRAEIQAVQDGAVSPNDSPLHHAPHTAALVAGDNWTRAYSRETAAFPAAWVRDNKFWPAVARIDNTYGDRNLVCACPPARILRLNPTQSPFHPPSSPSHSTPNRPPATSIHYPLSTIPLTTDH